MVNTDAGSASDAARAAGTGPLLARNEPLLDRKSVGLSSRTRMALGKRGIAVLAAVTIIAVAVPCFTAQPPTADESIAKERSSRQTLQTVKRVAQKPKWGFFGTIFHLILEQVNDTKSAYTQISDLVNAQFSDNDEPAVTTAPDPADNGTTPTPKISRAEFLKILDRNLKGLARLRNLEWREAKKDSRANIQRYKEEIFGGKKTRKRR